MKPKFLGLAVLLLAGAAQGALAQDQNSGNSQRPPPQTPYTRPWMRPPQAPRPGPAQPPPPPPQARTPPPAPQAHAAPPPQPPPAQQPWRREDRGGPRAGWSGPQVVPPPAGRPPQMRPPQPPQGPADGRYRDQARPHEYRGDDGRRQDERWRDDRWRDDRSRDDRWRDRARPDVDHGRRDDDRDRRDGPRWAPHVYPPSYRSSRRFQGPDWIAPRGYYYRAWRFGEFLPPAWYSQDYWIDDWWDFDLPAPPPGYDWVRVGPDALLIDEDTGRIVQVVRFVFL